MKHLISLAVLVGLFTLAEAAPAPEAVTIKLRWTEEGDCNLIDKRDSNTTKMKIVDAQGKVLNETNTTETTATVCKETMLKREGKKRPIKLEREYSKAEVTRGDTTEDLGLKDKTVVIEFKDGKYTFTFKGGEEVTGAAAVMLTKEFADKNDDNEDLNKAMLPKNAVKAGDEWKLDMKPWLKSFTRDGKIEADEAKASGTAKLRKAYQKDGTPFGEINYKLSIPLKSLGAGIQFEEPAKAMIDMTLDLCIDGTSENGTAKTTFELAGTAALPEPQGGKLFLTITSEQQVTQKQVAKK